MVLQVDLYHCLGEPSLGIKGYFCVHIHLITGPIWREPAVKQTPVWRKWTPQDKFTGMAFMCYFPLLVTMAKFHCCSGGERLRMRLVMWKYLTELPDFKKDIVMNVLPGLDCFFNYHTPDTLHISKWQILFFFFVCVGYSYYPEKQSLKILTGW